MYDVIIIGAGTAGLSAAIYVCRAGKTALVLEGLAYGGQIINTPEIANYPAAPGISGFDFASKLYEQAKKLGARIVFEKACGLNDGSASKQVRTSKNVYEGKAIILAVGTKSKKLGVEREDSFVGRGVSYCATCDGAFYKNKTVAVVGGGNTAVEDALYLSDLANKVFLVHRRDSFRADESSVVLLQSRSNVEFVLDSVVKELVGEDRLHGIKIQKNDGSVREIDTDGLFVAIGRTPETEIFSGVVGLDGSGYITAEEDCLTTEPGIFAAGDARTKLVRQLVTAASDGAVAATQAIKYISSL